MASLALAFRKVSVGMLAVEVAVLFERGVVAQLWFQRCAMTLKRESRSLK